MRGHSPQFEIYDELDLGWMTKVYRSTMPSSTKFLHKNVLHVCNEQRM